jgi:hypothetical protein
MGGRGRNERLEREMDGDSLFQELRDGHMTPVNHLGHFVYRHTLSNTAIRLAVSSSVLYWSLAFLRLSAILSPPVAQKN